MALIVSLFQRAQSKNARNSMTLSTQISDGFLLLLGETRRKPQLDPKVSQHLGSEREALAVGVGRSTEAEAPSLGSSVHLTVGTYGFWTVTSVPTRKSRIGYYTPRRTLSGPSEAPFSTHK